MAHLVANPMTPLENALRLYWQLLPINQNDHFLNYTSLWAMKSMKLKVFHLCGKVVIYFTVVFYSYDEVVYSDLKYLHVFHLSNEMNSLHTWHIHTGQISLHINLSCFFILCDLCQFCLYLYPVISLKDFMTTLIGVPYVWFCYINNKGGIISVCGQMAKYQQMSSVWVHPLIMMVVMRRSSSMWSTGVSGT